MAQTERLFTANAELPNSLVTSLAQDSVGNLWIGTENGLCKYDGAKFVTFYHNASDSSTVLSNRISDIYVTSQGQVMIGTQGGLQIYDPDYNRFKEVNLSPGYDKAIPIHVASIKALSDGDIVLGTLGSGLIRIKSGTWEDSTPVLEKEKIEMFFKFLDVDRYNTVWTGGARMGAWRATKNSGGELELEMVPGSKDWKIEAIAADNRGNAYYATKEGLYKVSGEDLTFSLVFNGVKDKILCLELIGSNLLLMGTDGSGLIKYDIDTGNLTDLGFNTGRTDLSRTKISDILVDRNGNLLIGLKQKGLLACQPYSNQFEYIGPGAATKDLIGSQPVDALYESQDGTLWVVSDQDGLYAIQGNNATHYRQDENGLPPLIANVFMSSDGTVWILSIDTGLARLNRKTGKCTYLDTFQRMSVFDMVEDNQHRLWVGTMGEGLYCIDFQGKILYKAPKTDRIHYTPGSDLLHNGWLNSLTLSNDSMKLFINTCYGVGCYDLEVGSYVNTFGENRILEGEMCYESYQDSDGYLWIATTNGVYRWHPHEDKILHFDTDDGLCTNTIVGIVGDAHDNIWMATYYGLAKYDKEMGKFTNYYAHDGIQGNEFSLRSMQRNPQGRIYAGGLNGITVFDDISQQAKTPRLRIADVYLYDQVVTKSSLSGNTPIIKDSDKGRTYQFDVDDNSIGVELSTDQYNNSNIAYQYSIDNEPWSKLQPGSNRVYFSNLSPGNHTLNFKAISFGSESEVASLKIHIRQHWYLEWWAILIYCLIAVLSAFLIFRTIRNRRRMEAQIEEQKQKDEFNNSTMQLLVNIAHEIRTPISLIANPISQLADMHTDEGSKHLFAVVRNNINRTLQLVNQLLDVRKIDHNQLKLRTKPVELKEYLRNAMELFNDLAQRKHINYSLQADGESFYANIDPNQFDKIIVNLLSNAFKYTNDKGNITVKLTRNGENIEVAVYDDGVGIPAEHLPHIFDRFYQAEDKGYYSHMGSGVGLHLASLLASKHGGSISVENNPEGKGVTFTVTLPAAEPDAAEPTAAQDSEASILRQQVSQQIAEEPDYDLETKNLRSKATIVIVEDNPEIRSYLHEQLQSSYNIISFDNVKEALAEILAKKPDLVITDIVLGSTNGISLIKSIRQNINVNDIPIIVLSGKNDDADIMEAIECGADYYITKPFNIKLLKSHVNNLLSQRHRLKVIYRGDQAEADIVVDSSDIKTPDDQLLDRLSKAINNNISNPEYTIMDMASDVCMSRVHLNRKMKQLTNQSPSTYLRNMRLAKAAEILRDKPGIAVSDVATAVGITSFSHFSHIFKEFYGCAPSEYAERTRQN